MKDSKVTIKTLFILLISYSILFTTMLLIASLTVDVFFYFYHNLKITFDSNDIWNSVKSGSSAGIITGGGIWIMSRIKANKEK
jgi:hypothetical protein